MAGWRYRGWPDVIGLSSGPARFARQSGSPMIRTTLRLCAWSGCALLTVSQVASLATSAAAAETPARWDGSYLGVHVGYGRGTITPTLGGALSPAGQPGFGSLSGGVFGGYNVQTSNGTVFGVEADVTVPDSQPHADAMWAGTSPAGLVTEALGGLGSVRLRVGHAQDDWLGYVTGGFAAAISHTSRMSAPDADDNVAGSHLRLGWTVGAGVEYAFSAPWSLRAEVLYTNFGTRDVQPPGGPAYASRFDLWTARLGLAYRFTDEPGRTTKSAGAANGLDWELHGQSTYILQGYPAFRSPYYGANSLSPWPQAKATWTASVFLGVRVWDGGEVYYNPELLQGFGFNGTAGAGGFPNGEAQKSDFAYPRYNTSRLFLRHTFGFGGEQETVESDYGQMAGKRDVSRLSIQVGKFAVHDVFDTNSFANDPREDFLNWSIWAAGAFDYPADRLGLTYGAVADFNQKQWALRAGYFLVGNEPNSSNFDMALFRRGGYVTEFEQRYAIADLPGKIKLMGWMHNTFSGRYRDALDLVAATPGLDINDAIVRARRGNTKFGYVVNWEQALSDTVGVFGRWSWNNGRNEISAFTDIDASLSGGLSIKGASWGRPNDTVGLGGAINALSRDHRDYFAAGGYGVLVGDGRLNYGTEKILETYYAVRLREGFVATADYQLIVNPGYNRDRGPVSVFSMRLRTER